MCNLFKIWLLRIFTSELEGKKPPSCSKENDDFFYKKIMKTGFWTDTDFGFEIKKKSIAEWSIFSPFINKKSTLELTLWKAGRWEKNEKIIWKNCCIRLICCALDNIYWFYAFWQSQCLRGIEAHRPEWKKIRNTCKFPGEKKRGCPFETPSCKK